MQKDHTVLLEKPESSDIRIMQKGHAVFLENPESSDTRIMQKDHLLLCVAGKDLETAIILLWSLTLIHRYRTETSSRRETVLD